MNNRLMILALTAVAATASLRAQPSVIESYREAVVSRWEFQQRYPLAAKLFDGRESEADRLALIGQLRAAPAGAIPPPAGRGALWTDFALGMASERNRAGAGGKELAAAARSAKGDLAINYEFSRVMAQAGMDGGVRPWRDETHRSMLEKGYARLPELAKLELRRAREAMGEGRYPAAKQALDAAGRLDPLCGWVPFHRLLLHVRQTAPFKLDLGIAWGLVKESLHPIRYYDSQGLFLVNLSRALRLSLALFFGVSLLVLFARHFTRIAHPWAEKLPQAVDMRVRYLAIALVPLSLAVGGAGYALLGLLGAMMLWRHCSASEKTVLLSAMAAIGILPLVLVWEGSMARHLDARRGAGLYHEAYARGFEWKRVDRAVAFPARSADDSLYRDLAVSIWYRKQGDYPRSVQYARRASLAAPGDAYALLNSGNLAMATFVYGKAAETYAEARRSAPEMVETWFNSSQAELYLNNSSQHKEYLEKAAELDAPLITRWLKDNDERFSVYPATRKALEPMLRPGQAWRAAWRSLLDLDFLRVTVHTGIADVPGSWLLLGSLSAAFGLYFRFRRHTRHSHGRDLFECKMCSRVVCRSCRKGVHCQHCFKTVAGVHDNRIRAELIARLRNRSALPRVRLGSALNSIFPGAGHLYLNRKGRFAWLLAVSLLFGAWYGVNHMLMEYPAFVLGPLSWLPCLPLAFVYIVFNLRQAFYPVRARKAPAASLRVREAAR